MIEDEFYYIGKENQAVCVYNMITGKQNTYDAKMAVQATCRKQDSYETKYSVQILPEKVIVFDKTRKANVIGVRNLSE